jgi:hypothetical protein
MKLIVQLAAMILSLATFVGCNSGPNVVPVKGVVTRGGKPVGWAALTFYPSIDVRPSTAKADENCHFEVSFDRTTKGMVRGPNKVVVTFRPRNAAEEAKIAEGGKVNYHPDQDAIVAKYGKKETTPLVIEITKAEDNLQIKLD